jgi:hypothetical protein
MARLHEIVFDCRHPASIARFWAAALDDYEVAPYDEAELQRLRSIGINDPQDDPTVRVQAPGRQPSVFFQRVPENKAVKNRLHLDLRCESFESEKVRLTALGATVLAEQDTCAVLSDPEGNEFCLLDSRVWPADPGANRR